MQIHLLKLESEAYEEGSMIVSSDDEEEEEKEMVGSEDDWQCCYMTDMLKMVKWDESDVNPHERPLPVSAYENLENKYGRSQGSRCERKLLFDHVNQMVKERRAIAADPHPWVVAGGGRRGWPGERMEDVLRQKVRGEGGEEDGVVSMGEWMRLGEEMDVVGGEVGRMLIDQLLVELVAEFA